MPDLPAGAPGDAPRILIVEDDLHARRINSLALSSAGYEIHEAVDGADAVERAFEVRPDLIVMDLGLPGMNGLEATRRIKHLMAPMAPLIVVLTARAMREDVEAARQAGCDAHLAKPIDPFDLVHEVKRLLEARRGAA